MLLNSYVEWLQLPRFYPPIGLPFSLCPPSAILNQMLYLASSPLIPPPPILKQFCNHPMLSATPTGRLRSLGRLSAHNPTLVEVQLVVPDAAKSQVLHWGHSYELSCPPGFQRTLQLLEYMLLLWRKSLDSFKKNNCETCCVRRNCVNFVKPCKHHVHYNLGLFVHSASVSHEYISFFV